MLSKPTENFGSRALEAESAAHFFRARFRTYEMPPVKDAIVIGRGAPAGLSAFEQTLRLVSAEKFTAVRVDDEVVGGILVRETLLKKIGEAILTQFVLRNIKPFMASTEVLRLDLDLEILLEASV